MLHPTVFIEGDANLEVSDSVRVIDMVRSVRPGVPVVLLTSNSQKD
jgi:hypothetical protein